MKDGIVNGDNFLLPFVATVFTALVIEWKPPIPVATIVAISSFSSSLKVRDLHHLLLPPQQQERAE